MMKLIDHNRLRSAERRDAGGSVDVEIGLSPRGHPSDRVLHQQLYFLNREVQPYEIRTQKVTVGVSRALGWWFCRPAAYALYPRPRLHSSHQNSPLPLTTPSPYYLSLSTSFLAFQTTSFSSFSSFSSFLASPPSCCHGAFR